MQDETIATNTCYQTEAPNQPSVAHVSTSQLLLQITDDTQGVIPPTPEAQAFAPLAYLYNDEEGKTEHLARKT